ncbi:MAG: biotin/lipoyl-binding protein, partial [Anaerolineae bacterium]|nr:biotin/lipoyl-binding protein [Anaerolineae bacterium]
MRLKSVLIVGVTALSMVVLAACGGSEEAVEPATVEAAAIQQPNTVSAEAFVVPVAEADLSFEVSGRVVAVHVEEGQPVNAGDTLVELDDATVQAQVTQAQAGVTNAEASL